MTIDNFKPLQAQSFALAGGGAISGDVTVILKSFKQIDGTTNITMADLGSIAFMTLEPGNGTLEEQISFTGVTQNSNGTATLTGVRTVAFVDPYTSSSGLAKTHAGSTTAVLSNTSGYYDQFLKKDVDGIITGQYQFPGGGTVGAPVSGTSYITPTNDLEYASKKYVDTTVVFGAPLANTTTAGIVQEATQAQIDAKTKVGSTGAELFTNPSFTRSTLLSDYVADTGGLNVFQIAPSPSLAAYVNGQIFVFKAANANTGTTPATLAVNALSATTIYKSGGPNQNLSSLSPNDIVAGQILEVVKIPSGFQMLSPIAGSSPTGSIQMYAGSTLPKGWLLCDGTATNRTTYSALFAVIGTNYGTGDGSTTFNVPDLRGRVGVGKNSGTFGSLGATGGEETHTLTTPEIPSHTHSDVLGAGPASIAASGSGLFNVDARGNTGATGGGGAHNNLQPYQVVNYIIKT